MAGTRLAENSISQTKSDRSDRRSVTPLPRNLSVLETWGFGLTGHLAWISAAPAMHNALGPSAILLWLPGSIIGMLLNFQVQRLGREWPDMTGGTPNYAARLLKKYPLLARYGALAYFFSWVAFPAINALVLTDLIKANLEPLGISCPETALKVGFTAIAFIVGFAGTRALSILHLCFVLPAVGFLLVFCTQGIGWLLLSPASPGFFPTRLPPFSFVDWAKWFFFAVYATYACETASSFVGDNRRPGQTLRFLSFAAWLIPIVYLGGSWVLMRLATEPGLGDNTFLNLLAAAKPFWGSSASFLVTLLLASSCLLCCATAVANCPRMLYQLAADGYLSPVFTVVSRREVFGPGLAFTFLLSLVCLAWGDLESLVMVTATAFVAAMMSVHLGVWLNRGKPEARWPWQSLGFFLIEAIALVVGGLAWDRQNLAIGLLFPIGILAMDAAIRRIPFAPFHPDWWVGLYRRQSTSKIEDFLALQVGVLIFLLCSTAALSWGIKAKLDGLPSHAGDSLLVVLLITVAFVGVAIACWTSLPQVAAIAEARQQAERRFMAALDTAVDGVLVLDESGAIVQANPAALEILGREPFDAIGHRLNEFLPELVGEPGQWPQRSEQAIGDARAIETTLSQRSREDFREYIVILRDITDRKQAEMMLQSSADRLEMLVQHRTEQLNKTVERLQSEIEARQQTEAALETEREFLNALLDNLQEGIVACDASGVLTLFNKTTRELQGLSEQPIPAEQWAEYFDLYLPDGKTPMSVQDIPLFRALQGQSVRDLEMVIAPKQGNPRFLLANGQAIIDASGKKLGAVVAMHDITERRKAQEALARANEELEWRVQQRTAELQQSHRRINSILESITDAFFALDREWRFTYLNQQAELLLQRRREELIGKNVWDEFPEAVGFTFYHQYHKAVAQQVSVTFEEFYPPLDTWFEVRAYPSEDGLSIYFGNITERKTSEAALQESEAQFRHLAAQEELLNRLAAQIRNSLELEMILETALKEIYNLLAIDACTFSWYRPDVEPPSWEVVKEVKKDHLPTWVGQLHPDEIYRPYTEKILRRQIVRVDDTKALEGDPALQQLLLAADCASALGLPIHTPSGRIGMVSCSRFRDAQPWTESELTLIEAMANQLAIAINQAELYDEARSSARVATEQALQLEKALQELQQTQAQLIQTEKMSSLGQLVAGVAHEINNPVNFIYGNITHLENYTQHLLDLIHLYQQRYTERDAEIEALIEESELEFVIEDLPKILSSMKVGAQRIREIVSTLRNFSRLDEADKKPVDIHEGIDSTLLILQNRLNENPGSPEIQLVKEYGDLPKIECYASQLNQVFMNVLNNALDALHARDKGRSPQQIKENPSTITIQTRVLDKNRVGISIKDNGPGMADDIVSQIFNPFFTTKPVGKGTGLGLAISYQIIVDKHGGRLECKSQPGRGAEFWIELPI